MIHPQSLDEAGDRKRQANRDKRLAKKARWQKEREELNRYRSAGMQKRDWQPRERKTQDEGPEWRGDLFFLRER